VGGGKRAGDKDRQLYDMYVQWIWSRVPEVYRDELNMCEDTILQGIKWILDAHAVKVQTIPADGDVIVTVSPDVLNSDLNIIREELSAFFGSERKVGVVRAGELSFIRVQTSDVPTEGAARPMDRGGE
jgi:hypothetical protein